MKRSVKYLIILALALFTSTAAEAQLRFGIKAGMNVDKMHLDNSIWDASNRTGFTGGVMLEFTVPVVGIGFDLSAMYARLNSEVSEPLSSMILDYKHSAGKDFLQIPLNLKYKLNLPLVSSIVKPYAFTGPSFNFRLDDETWENVKSKRCQVAWNLGVGVELINHLQLSGSYSWGINHVASGTNLLFGTQNLNMRNNYWTITAGWLF